MRLRIGNHAEPSLLLTAGSNAQTGATSIGWAGVKFLPGQRLDFRDPSGNRVQVVQYDQIQFTKSPEVLNGMGLRLGKTEGALAELREKRLS